ncbi:LysB family phage lysis regulatory protein [Kosakonia sp. SMBL-WEM22]|uniref:Rz-like lysis system protein LysB n=1 Tax=Kosakonia sp. SMBL-WEM22 TaxID=2725560 RepID=UPI0016596DA0|nr:Rz-like lysis system protein LysB [Kosakonia sp. SMBL-WEM22]MDV5357786.1 Rz-like lysis system protein LysB [Enterobacter asburiae]QNQ21488.1 LysB family phage lysis regulatory protein [Kosakonia sp. SMBL-WEM22]
MNARLAALLLTALSGLWLVEQNYALRASLANAQQLTREQSATLTRLKSTLNATAELAAKNQQAQVTLRQRLDAASAKALQRENAITRLLNENEAFRHWYRTELPDAVRRVHQRPACPSAAHCLQQLPAGQPLSDAGKRAAN